jgi:hypothetical protein
MRGNRHDLTSSRDRAYRRLGARSPWPSPSPSVMSSHRRSSMPTANPVRCGWPEGRRRATSHLNDPAASDSSSRGSRDPPRGATGWIRQDEADRSEPDDRPTTRLPTRCGVERKLKRANGEPTRAERHLVIFDYLRAHGLRNDRSDAPRVTAQVGRQARGDRVLAASPGTRSMSGTRS